MLVNRLHGRVVKHIIVWHNSMVFNGEVYNGNKVGAVSRVSSPHAILNRLLLVFGKVVILVMCVYFFLEFGNQFRLVCVVSAFLIE